MEQPTNISALKELKDVPGYFIDVERTEVWSFRKRRFTGGKTWYKLSLHERNLSKTPTFVVQLDGKKRELTIGRAIYAVTNNLPYYDLSLSAFNFYYNQNKVDVEEKGDAISRGWKDRMVRYDRHRIENVEHNIKVLQLLLSAYRGKSRKLIEYVYERKPYYINCLRKSQSYHISAERAEIGFRLAFDRMMKVIDEGGGIICDFDGWFLKTAYKHQQALYIKNSKHVNIDKLVNLTLQ